VYEVVMAAAVVDGNTDVIDARLRRARLAAGAAPREIVVAEAVDDDEDDIFRLGSSAAGSAARTG